MAKTWHYTTDGTAAQVLDEKTFAEHCRTGKVPPTAMVWTAGMDAWRSYAELSALEEANAKAAAEKAARAQAEADAAGQIERRVCAKCNKDWPVPLMVQSKSRWLCRACNAREVEAARAEAERKAGQKSHLWNDSRFIIGFGIGFAVLCATGVLAYQFLKDRWDAPPTQAPEEWAALPPGQWPQITLPAEVQMRGWPQPLHPANNFFVVDGHLHVLGVGFSRIFQEAARLEGTAPAATSAPSQPVPADVLLRRLDASLVGWNMGTGAVFKAVHGNPGTYGKSEVVLLDADPALTRQSKIPATALRVRELPFNKGMRIFVVGAPPVRPGGKQTVYTGTLHGTLTAQKVLDLEMDAPIDPATLLGAPVLDEGGYLMGVADGSFDSPDKNGQIKTLSAESLLSFAGPLGLIRDGPAAAAATPAAKKK